MKRYKEGSIWRKWDLHIHSNASDGKMTCQEIIDKAIERGIKVIALTDHHTVKNIDSIKEYAKDKCRNPHFVGPPLSRTVTL